MILHDTPYKDIFRVMEEEEPKVKFALKKLEDKIVRPLNKKGVDDFVVKQEYTVPTSRNKYFLFIELHREGRHAYTHGEGVLSLSDPKGQKLYMRQTSVDGTEKSGRKFKEERIEMYTAHLLRRFRERDNQPNKFDTEDVLIEFIHATQNTAQLNHEPLTSSKEKYNDNSAAFQIVEGLVFGTKQECRTDNGKTFSIVRYNTFVSNEMLREKQIRNILPPYIIRLLEASSERNKFKKDIPIPLK